MASDGALGMPPRSLQGMTAKQPEVSVVMSVYNGASSLAVTMDSILSQEGVDLEYIVVDDGSTDKSGEILDDYGRRDNRVRVIHQENTGLTRALIRACALASGEFIARQDAGDVSLPRRLAMQLSVFRDNPTVVMTSCGTRYIGPAAEVLYEICQHGDELHWGLQHIEIERLRGPSHHTSVMFRRKSYETVGGYRLQFKVAQDLDLWIRLSEVGICWATPDVLCEARLHKNSISASRRSEQIRSANVIIKCAEARRCGRDDSALIARWVEQSEWRQPFLWRPRRLQQAKFYYFIGSLLPPCQSKQARLYFWRAVSSWAAYPRAWYKLLRAWRQI
jgi:glycosyltransferase involved in cell wall biosynthesis